MSTSKPIVGYWDFRGLGQPVRSLLAYAGVDFTDKRYSRADGKGQEWLNEKFNLGFDFPNLPYLIDGNVKLTQTLAILRYLARKYKLDGANEAEKNAIAVLEQQVTDLNVALFKTIFDPNFETVKVEYLKNLPDSLKQISNFIGSKQFSVGPNVTYVDFWLYEYLIKVKLFAPEAFNQFPNLGAFVTRLETQPKLAAWLKKQGPQKFVGFGPFQAEY
uniref:glutathione transferase n=1 Tax=Aleuroglyphus ovatus TaxID=212130 RepID=B0KZK7_ALEOV|nr:allergen Ale o 8 [Aleuroglyphus ovatus]